MCPPLIPLIGLAISAASAASSYQAQRTQAAQTKAAIEREELLQQNDLARQRQQQFDASNAEMNAFARDAAKDSALFDVVTGEYGGGNSAVRAATIGDVQSGEQFATLSDNSNIAQGEASFRSLSMREQALSRIGAIQRPSGFGTALQIGAAGVNAYSPIKAAQDRASRDHLYGAINRGGAAFRILSSNRGSGD